MELMLAVGIPVFLIFGGALLAFSFAGRSSEAPADAEPRPEVKPLVFFQAVGWSRQFEAASIEEIVASIEKHLREERQATAPLLSGPPAFLE